MMNLSDSRTYVLDTNVFVEAHRRYYAFDLCPGFWECLSYFGVEGRLLSIDRVRKEMLAGDALSRWLKDEAPQALFASTAERVVIEEFSKMMAWVHGHSQFSDPAKAEFAAVADGWLAAYAKAHDMVVVTHEVFSRDAKKSVPLPNVCREFGVVTRDTFQMLRELEVAFGWDSRH